MMDSSLLVEEVPEKSEHIRCMWLYKIMAYIYEMFFLDHNTQHQIYRYQDDIFLLMAITLSSIIILLLFGVRLYAYVKYRRSIQTEIQVVNTKLKSMLVSIDIVKKIIQIHECIVQNQREIEYMWYKKSEVEADEDVKEIENVCVKQNDITVEGNVRDLVHVLETGMRKSANQNPDADKEASAQPVSRKSKTRYTVLSSKSRSQPNIQNMVSEESEIKVKRSSSDTALSCDGFSSCEELCTSEFVEIGRAHV